MELWMDLLFGNWVGLLSMIVVFSTAAIIGYLLIMLIRRSGHH